MSSWDGDPNIINLVINSMRDTWAKSYLGGLRIFDI